MVLGTALALAPAGAHAEVAAPETSARAVADLGRYCTACWRNARLPVDVWADCTQEVFRRLLERVPTDAWERVLGEDGDERLEFMRAIDAVKKRVRRARKTVGAVDGLADRREPHARHVSEEREAVDRTAVHVLSERQQHILRRSFEGWSVHDIAGEMDLPAARVSDEKYKAIHRLRAAVREREHAGSRLPA
jgi:RNA polymerase sigma factor (sigma-70 family)